MQIIHTLDDLHCWRADNTDVALVPTMGNLHDGHLALVELARQHAAKVMVSIFVNPLQFGPNEDFSRYPRTLEADCARLKAIGVDAVFAPDATGLFPQPQRYHVEPPELANELCGAFRPGHFRGVATIVLKLLNLVQPRVAVFGRKDYQQLAIIRGLCADLNVPVQIVAGDTVRVDDGLALSSRNGFLSPTERAEAPRLYRVLGEVRQQLVDGKRDFYILENAAIQTLSEHGWRVDYIAIRTPVLELPVTADRQFVVLGAAHLGSTRLIDNIELTATKTL
ncbi:pantoate--beta-alanine ligase [Sulfuriferula sp.]|uniref:pantoate--beta-alanine ligase n=1 Tax=Sulfuriferula sp. TaxID=2025307 RepID=UPI00273067AE|nr:pantoate--beta-alanine ligase [Sulfuriferula sp.]MDP2025545.1 pantoate--beta-alanine ligase [Sulfuriferula sp.]